MRRGKKSAQGQQLEAARLRVRSEQLESRFSPVTAAGVRGSVDRAREVTSWILSPSSLESLWDSPLWSGRLELPPPKASKKVGVDETGLSGEVRG